MSWSRRGEGFRPIRPHGGGGPRLPAACGGGVTGRRPRRSSPSSTLFTGGATDTGVGGLLFAITMVKNEQRTIGHVVEHLLAEGLDHVIVADNLSTDRTREVLDALVVRGLPVTVVDDPE